MEAHHPAHIKHIYINKPPSTILLKSKNLHILNNVTLMKVSIGNNDFAPSTEGDDIKAINRKRFEKRVVNSVKIKESIQELEEALKKLKIKQRSSKNTGVSVKTVKTSDTPTARKKKTKQVVYAHGMKYTINAGEEDSPYLNDTYFTYDSQKSRLFSIPEVEPSESPILSYLGSDVDFFNNIELSDGLYDHVERILLLCVSLYDSKSYMGMMSSFLSYCKSYHVQKSIVVSLHKLLSTTYQQYSAQAGFVDTICDFMDNWSDFVKLPIFNYVGRIIAISVSLGLCSASKLSFDFDGVKLFAVEALKRQSTAVDLIDAVLVTVRYFLSSGIEAFKTGSLRPFLFPNQRVAQIEQQYYQAKVAMNLYSSGNLASSDIKSESDLFAILNRLKDDFTSLKAVERDQIMRRLVEQRLVQIYEWIGQLTAKSTGGQLRVSPYTFLIWGRSGYGKSAISTSLIQAILCANGFDYKDPTRIVTINPADKFISNAKADTLAYIFDDMGAENPQKQDTNHARRWLDMSNNIAGYANMADIQDKGMCTFNHKVQVGTSNHTNGGMDTFSTYPIAVARRGTRDEVRLLSQYMNAEGSVDSLKVSTAFPQEPNKVIIPDIYRFTVRKATEHLQNRGQYTWNIVQWDNGTNIISMDNVDYKTYIAYHVHQSQLHFQKEDAWVQSARGGPQCLQLCSKCNMLNSLCGCAYVSNFGFEDVGRALGQHVVTRVSQEIIELAHLSYRTIRSRDWLSFVPDWVLHHPLCRAYVYFHIQNITSQKAWLFLFPLFLTLMYFIYSGKWIMGLVNFVFICMICTGKFVIDAAITRIFFVLADRERHTMQARLRVLQRQFIKCVAFSAGLITVIKLYQMYRSTKKFTMQGNLSPTCLEDVEKRDNEQSMWAQVVTTPLPTPAKSKRSCFEHLKNLVQTNQLYVSCEDGGRRPFSNALMVKTGFCILPYHMLFDDPRVYIFQRNALTVLGTSFKAMICKKDAVLVPGTDLALVYIPSCGDFKSLVDYLAIESPASGWASLIYKNKDGTFADNCGFKIYPEDIYCGELALNNIKGIGYELPYNSFRGLCGATLVTNNKVPIICGFHSVGVENSVKGASSVITLKLFEDALSQLASRFSSVGHLADQGELHTVQHGISYIESQDVHLHSPCRFIDVDLVTSCGVFGSVIGRNRVSSKIHPTSIASKVREVFDRPLLYGPPKFYLGKHWRSHLLKCFCPSHGCSQSLLEKAVNDYKTMIPRLLSIDSVKKSIVPLSQNAIVNGIDGVRFIDRMKTTSSMGFPINKSKINYLQICDGPNAINFDFPADIWETVRECEETYLRGERWYPIFRACVKDEIKSLSSEKVRIFEAAPIVLQILIRKYFLAIARVFSLYPLETECAVGINAVSKEWDQLIKYVRKFGAERMIAGDYTGYDTRMPAQFTVAAFNIFIEVAELSGNYSERDLTIMRAMVTDIIYPVVAFNGDLVMMCGTNPSGQNMTVYINSIVNSLYLRVSFFSMYPDLVFRDHVGLATYGDDFVGSVAEKCPKFNFKTLKKFLEEIDITLTLPDKSDSDVEYLTIDQADFLKRKTFFNPDLGHEVGLLEEESILRSLVCQEQSSNVTPNEQLAGAVSSALNEYFFYGKEKYDDVRNKLNIILADFPLRIDQLKTPYESRLALLKDRE